MAAQSKATHDGLHVLVIGAGMYTCGRGTDGYGTVLPALYQAAKSDDLVSRVTCCATTAASASALGEKARALSTFLEHEVPLDTWPREAADPETYRKLIALDTAIDAPHRFDCAIVVVPDHLHYQVAKDLLDAGIHTLLVKPFVPRVAEGLELVKLAASKNCLGMVEFHKRWDQSNLLLRDRLAAGEIGDPLYFHIEYSQRRTIPEETFSDWVGETNIFQYLGVHYVDMIWFLTDAWPLRVLSMGQKSRLASRGIDAHDALQTVVEWRHEGRTFVSTHLTNWIDPSTTSAMSDQAIKVIGGEGRIECDQKHRGVHVVTEAGIEEVNPYFSQFSRDANGGRQFAGYGYDSIRAFLGDVSQISTGQRAVGDLEGVRPTFRNSLVSTAVVEASNMSLELGGEWVTVDPGLEEQVRQVAT